MSRSQRKPSQRGLSVIELMVGVAVGMFVVGGAIKLFVDYVVANKRQLVETRVNQDIRAAADLVARDVRRAGYWENATSGLTADNPYAITTLPAAGEIQYAYARNNDDVPDNNERVGFRRQVVGGIGVLQVKDGLTWQAITDPGTLDVTVFTVTAAAPALVNDMSRFCPCLYRMTCTAADMTNLAVNPLGPRMMGIPAYNIVLTGRAVGDAAIVRTISETVRLRNPVLTGGCPAP
jgi:prepilin peptidase dependent protein B